LRYLVKFEMPQICVVVPEELNEKFRYAAFRKFGPKKGSLTLAGLEAFKLWLEKNE